MGPGTSFQATIFIEVLVETSFIAVHKLAKFHYQTVFIPKLFSKMCFLFHSWALDDVMTFEYQES